MSAETFFSSGFFGATVGAVAVFGAELFRSRLDIQSQKIERRRLQVDQALMGYATIIAVLNQAVNQIIDVKVGVNRLAQTIEQNHKNKTLVIQYQKLRAVNVPDPATLLAIFDEEILTRVGVLYLKSRRLNDDVEMVYESYRDQLNLLKSEVIDQDVFRGMQMDMVKTVLTDLNGYLDELSKKIDELLVLAKIRADSLKAKKMKSVLKSNDWLKQVQVPISLNQFNQGLIQLESDRKSIS